MRERGREREMNQSSEVYISSAICECENIQSEKKSKLWSLFTCSKQNLFSLLNDHKQHGKADWLNLDFLQKE